MSTTVRGGQVRRVPRGPSSDERLLTELQRTAERIRMVDLATAALMLTVAWMTYLLAVAVVDQALRPQGLPGWVRQGLFAIFALVSGVFAWFRLIQPAFHKVSLLYAAWRLEKSARVTRHAVTAYLDLKQRPLPSLVKEALRREAQEDLRYTDPEAAAPHRHTMRWFFVLVGLLVLLGVFALFVPEQFLSLMARAFWPFTPIAIPTDTRFELLAPERDGPYVEPQRQPVMEIGVKRGQTVTVRVKVHGLAPPEVWLETWVQQGEQPYRRSMTALDDYRTEWKFTLGASDLPASGLYFRVVGGDGQSRTYRLVEQLTNPPEVREFDITIHYPAYTAREPKKQTIGPIEALVGSEIELAVFGDQPISDGELVLEYGQPARQEILPLIQAPDRDSQHQPNRVFLDGRLQVEEKWAPKARYGIRLRNKSRQMGTIQWYDVQVLTDKPPVITLDQVNRVPLPPAEPAPQQLSTPRIPVNAAVPVDGTANDDFAVDRVWLMLQELEGQRRLMRIAHEKGEIGPVQKANGFTPIVPAPYQLILDLNRVVVVNQSRELPESAAAVKLIPGTKLRLWVEGTDCKSPQPNLGRSREVIIELVEPENPPQNSQNPDKPDDKQKPNSQERPQPDKPEDKPPEGKPDKAQSQQQPDKAQPQPEQTKPSDSPSSKPQQGSGQGDKPQSQDNQAAGREKPADKPASDKPTQQGTAGAEDGGKPSTEPNKVPVKPSDTASNGSQDKPQPNNNTGAGASAEDKPRNSPNANAGSKPGEGDGQKPMAGGNPLAGDRPDSHKPMKPETDNQPAQGNQGGSDTQQGNNPPNGEKPGANQNPGANAQNPQGGNPGPSKPSVGNKPDDASQGNAGKPADQSPQANKPTAQAKPDKPSPGGPG